MLRHILLFIILGLMMSACGKKSNTPHVTTLDFTYTLDSAYRLADNNGALANQILDSLERREYLTGYTTIPDYKFQFARAYVASRQLRPNLAISHLIRVLKNHEAVQDTATYIRSLNLIGSEYSVLGRYDDCQTTLETILAAAEASDNQPLYNQTLINRSIIHAHLGNYPAAIADVRTARDLMSKQSFNDNRLDIIFTYELEANYLSDSGNNPQAIRRFQYALKAFKQLTADERKGSDYEQTDRYNFRKAHIHISLATLFAQEHRPDSSAYHYKAWHSSIPNGLQPVISSEFYSLVVNYYMTTEQYDKALIYTHAYNDTFGSNRSDTVTMFNVVMHNNLSALYAAKGDYHRAWKHLSSAKELSDSINNRSNNALSAEMEAIYDDVERRQQIISQSSDIHSQRMYIAYLFVTVLITLTLGALAWHNYKRARNKNRILVSQIKELHNTRKMLDPTAIPPVEKPNPNSPHKELHKRFYNAMQQEKLFLLPNITRQSVATALGTNTTYLSNAIRENYDMTFSEYLNWLRLEHAKEILLRDNETKIEAIAAGSGFYSVRTFYRLFRDKYGVTPTEYRNIILTNK